MRYIRLSKFYSGSIGALLGWLAMSLYRSGGNMISAHDFGGISGMLIIIILVPFLSTEKQ